MSFSSLSSNHLRDLVKTPCEYSFLTEFQASAIPDRLTGANIKWVEGEYAVQILVEHAIAKAQKNTSYVTVPARKILDRYQFVSDGGWVAYGCNPIGTEQGDVAYFKPLNPRVDFERHRKIKYETPPGCEALPIQPWVDIVTAQAIYRRYGVTPLEGETFWQVVRRCNLPIVITEGLKKALSLIAHGLPAIALRGIACWHRKGTLELFPALSCFATHHRKIYIAFDQDEKRRTIRDVKAQAFKLGNVLEQVGCQVRVLKWDRNLGKGIDDAIAFQEANHEL